MDFFEILPKDYPFIPSDLLELASIVEGMTIIVAGKDQNEPETIRLSLLTSRFMGILAEALEVIPRFSARIKIKKQELINRFYRAD